MKSYAIGYADWSPHEYAAIARCLLQLRILEGPHIEKLARQLGQLYSPASVHLLNYGHQAICVALDMFREARPGASEVIIPTYICPSVPRAIARCGLVARGVNVLTDLNIDPDQIKTAINRNTLAVIAPHMYGSPAQISDIEKICSDAGVFLIDDAAQVAGVQQDERLLGTFGDAGILSFAQSKTIVTGVAGSGGALFINQSRWRDQAAKRCAVLPTARSRLPSLLDFLWNYMGARFTGDSGYYFRRALSYFGTTQAAQTTATRIANVDASLALAQFERLQSIVDEKIRIASDYHAALESQKSITMPQYSAGRFLARAMVLLPPHADLSRVRTLMRKDGIDTRPGYGMQDIPGVSTEQSRMLSQRLMNLPTVRGIGKNEIQHICAVLGRVVEANAST